MNFEVRWKEDKRECLIQPKMLYVTMTYPISSLPKCSLASLASCFAYSSSMFALEGAESERRSIPAQQTVAAQIAYLSFQKALSSSIVLVEPRILANRTSTPPSPAPQKALQKSSERLANSGEFARANLARDVVDDVRLAI